MKAVAVMGLFLFTACTTVSSVTTRSPSTGAATAASSPAPVNHPPVSVSPALAPPSVTPVVLMKLDCRLPVTWTIGSASHVGFLSLAAQTLVDDATAPTYDTFYDRAYHKWLPTTRNAVSGDGSRYAYEEGSALDPTASGTLHVVDVATGADHIAYSGRPVFKVIDFASEGIYVSSAVPEVATGLWLVNPSGGQPRLINSAILQPAVGNGAAWGLGFNSADPHPGEAGMMGPQNEILRYNLGDGSSTQWFYQPGASFWMAGPDYSGNLFVDNLYIDSLGTGTYDILEIAADAKSSVVYEGSSQPAYSLNGGLAAVDSYGTWFGGASATTGGGASVWLTSEGLLREVATISQADLSIAGGCIPSGS